MPSLRATALVALLALPAGIAFFAPAASLPVDTGTGPEPYHIWPYLTADLAALAALHPEHAKWTSIGRSALGLDLWALEVADFDSLDGSEPVVVLDGGHHGNEQLGMEAVYALAMRLLNDYDEDPQARRIVDDTRLLLVPSVNPDGTVKDTRRNALLVDLNRNYPFHWGEPGCSHSITSPTFCGFAAGDQPETQVMTRFLEAADPDVYVTMHTGITYLLHPWGWSRAPPPDDALYRNVAGKFRALTGIAAGQASTSLYVASGTSQDWAYGVLGTPSWTFEVHGEQWAPLSLQDIETRLAVQLRGLAWFLENAGRMGGRVAPGAAEVEPLGDGAFAVRFALANDGFGGAPVTVTLDPAGAPLAVTPPSVVVDVPAEGAATAAFTVVPGAEGAWPVVLRLQYERTAHLGKAVTVEGPYAAAATPGGFTVNEA